MEIKAKNLLCIVMWFLCILFVKKFVPISFRSKWTSKVYSWAFKYEQHQSKFGLGSTSATHSQCRVSWIPIDLQAYQLHYPKYNQITHQCQGSDQYSGTFVNTPIPRKTRPTHTHTCLASSSWISKWRVEETLSGGIFGFKAFLGYENDIEEEGSLLLRRKKSSLSKLCEISSLGVPSLFYQD